LLGIQAELGRRRFLVSQPAPPVRLKLFNNSSLSPVTIEAIDASESWIQFDGRNQLPLVLECNSTREMTISVDAMRSPESYEPGVIIIQTNVGTEELPMEVLPRPALSVAAYSDNNLSAGRIFEVILDHGGKERNLVRIAASQGVAEIEDIAVNQPWINVRLPADWRFPFSLDARQSAYVDVYLDVDETALAKETGSQHEAALRIQCAGFSGEEGEVFEERFIFRCWRPPELWVHEEEKRKIDAWPGQLKEFVLTLQNSAAGRPETGAANAPLRVSGIEIQDLENKPCSWLKPAKPFEAFDVPGGGQRKVKFAFTTSASGPQDSATLGIGRHGFLVTLTTNLKQTRRILFEVDVKPVERFLGALAVDFGTSNTCCAVCRDSDGEYRLVPVDRPEYHHPTTVPTVIQYLSLDGGEPVVRIGAEVDELEQVARVVESTARSLKRRLGTPDPLDIHFYSTELKQRYPAQTVVCEYLRQVRLAAERENPGVRFHDIVMTHPSRFKLRQILELKAAMRDAFGQDCDIRPLPEPVAAALGFIMEPEFVSKERYTVGVFDFGGGTTDLSLIEVVNRRQGKNTLVRPRQIDATGRWFGGEDLTAFVYDQALEGCQRMAAADYSGRILCFDTDMADGNLLLLAKENRGRLQQWAEHTKLLLFQHGDEWVLHMPSDKPSLFPNLKLGLWSNGRSEEGEFRPQIAPKRAALDTFLRTHVEALADDLAGLVERNQAGRVDYLRLSGKASANELVHQILHKRFPEATLHQAAEPKECVVEGACIFYRQESFGGARVQLVFEDSGFVRTTSRIGFAFDREFVEVIRSGVAVGPNGITGTYDEFLLRPQSRIRLAENTSLTDTLKGNRDVTPLGTFRVAPSYSGISNGPVSARLEVRLSRELTPSLAAFVGDEPVPLVAEQNQTFSGEDIR
jgi:hypothetical protein